MCQWGLLEPGSWMGSPSQSIYWRSNNLTATSVTQLRTKQLNVVIGIQNQDTTLHADQAVSASVYVSVCVSAVLRLRVSCAMTLYGLFEYKDYTDDVDEYDDDDDADDDLHESH